jgi:ribosome-associated protein
MKQKLIENIVAAIQDKKGHNIVSLDLGELEGTICDAFVICNADSTTQVDAIADGIVEALEEKLGEKPRRVEGKTNAVWVAVDYVDVMVHIFLTPLRDYYRLEQLWADAPATRYESEEETRRTIKDFFCGGTPLAPQNSAP